jgi:hypothetical protein
VCRVVEVTVCALKFAPGVIVFLADRCQRRAGGPLVAAPQCLQLFHHLLLSLERVSVVPAELRGEF